MEAINKYLIIVGAAPCAGEDLNAVPVPYKQSDFMMIGLDAVDKFLWFAKYFATYHPLEIEMSRERRRAAGGNTKYSVIAHQQHAAQDGTPLVDMIIPFEPPTGSSSLLGVLAGIKLGYRKIIICGCPLIGKNDKEYDYANFREGWMAKREIIRDVARSMSGWTRELLGAPTIEWITDGDQEAGSAEKSTEAAS